MLRLKGGKYADSKMVFESDVFYILHNYTRIFSLALKYLICYIIDRKGKATEAALPPNNNFLPHKRQAVTIASSGGYFFFPL